MIVRIIGGGLAGSEAAWQLANRGIKVELFERKGISRHPAFKTDLLSELICSNSLRSDNIENAVGLLKSEMQSFASLIMEAAHKNRVEAGTSLAVDRLGFSEYITDKIKSHPNIMIINQEVTDIDINKPTIIAAGPLCEGELSKAIAHLCDKDYLYFYDAVSPIIEKSSIDFNHAYYKSRWMDDEKGDYINCPLTRQEFDDFYQAVITAETIDVKQMDKEIYFEGCMPFEAMAQRGYKTLLYGPMKPVGLRYNGMTPYAVVQLRKDNAIDTLYNIVGFQTHLTFKEQKRVLSMIPALKNANIVRYGVMHRNTYINSPKVLNANYQMIKYPNVFVAGQISGVEGYIESAASGLYAAIAMYQHLNDLTIKSLPACTMMGAMAKYISNPNIEKLVPMNANFGIFECDVPVNKQNKKTIYVSESKKAINDYLEYLKCLKN